MYFSLCPLVLPAERSQGAAICGNNVNGFDFRVTTVMDEDEQDDGAVPKADKMWSFLITN